MLGRTWPGVAQPWLLWPAAGLLVFGWRNAATRPRLWGAALATALLLAGGADYGLQRSRLPGWEGLPPREARLELRVDHLFPSRDRTKVNGLGTVRSATDPLGELTGQTIYFSLARPRAAPDIVRSAMVEAIGLLEVLPLRPATNTFEGYLTSTGANFRLTRGRLLREVVPPTAYHRFCAMMAARFHALLGEGIAAKRPRLAGLLRAMMLGATQELSDDQRTLFLQSGTMHLFAISGLNIGVVALALESLLRLARLPLGIRFAVGSILLWLFVDITGGSPSAVRAFFMAAFVLSARVLRRPGNSFAALAASALAVLLVAPMQVFGASFLMSYAIVAALFLLGLPLAEDWQTRWALWRTLPPAVWQAWQRKIDFVWRGLLTSVAIGVSTTLISLITGVEFFSLVTPASLPLNLALIPAAGLATVGGFAALLFGLTGFHAAVVLCNHASALMLLAIEWLVRASVNLPGSAIAAQFSAPWIGPVAFGLTLAALLGGYAARWSHPWRWWPPFAVVAAALVLGTRFG